MGDAVGTHGKVAAMSHQQVIGEDGDHAARDLHCKGRDADADDVLDDVLGGFQETPLQVQQFFLSTELPQLPTQDDSLSQHCRNRGALDTHVQWPDKDGVKDNI